MPHGMALMEPEIHHGTAQVIPVQTPHMMGPEMELRMARWTELIPEMGSSIYTG